MPVSLRPLRLFHKLFALLAATAALSALAMAAVLSFNLQRGFNSYLRQRDAELLDQFVAAAQHQLAEAPARLDTLLPDMARRNLLPEAPPTFRPLAPGAPPAGRPGHPPPPAFALRLMLFTPEGRQLAGPPPPPDWQSSPMFERRVLRLEGRVLGQVVLLPRGPVPRELDARFLRGQYLAAAALSAVLLGLAGSAAYWLARGGVARLTRMQQATRAIAGGDFAARVATSGTDELAEMGADINDMAASLARLDSARRRWLAEIGHELRTPLAVLRGELEALRDGVRPLGQPAIAALSDEAERLGLLVDDLHYLAVSDLAAPVPQWRAANAVALVSEVAERFAPMLADAGLDFSLDTGPGQVLAVRWDPARIEQLLANLLVNAARYTAAPGTVRLALRQEGPDAEVVLEDSPPGCAPELLDRLFEPLFRIEPGRERASGGSGLGLAVAAAIARAHHGTIRAEASALGGLRMILRLPLDAETP